MIISGQTFLMSKAYHYLSFVSVLLVSLAFGACAPKAEDKDVLELNPAATAATSYNEGLQLITDGQFNEAAKKFTAIEQNFPYAESSRAALIMSSFAYYRSGKHAKSNTAAERYISLYPAGEDVDYALYLLGESNFTQIKNIDRDQAFAKKARRYFDEIVRRFPDSKYAAPSRLKADQAHDHLGGKEMNIGRYYLRQNDHVAAINRFKVVLTDYQTTRHVEEALYRLTEAYLSLGVVSEAQAAAAILGYNYPESEWYKLGYDLLAQNSLLPKSDKNSWFASLKSKSRN